MSYYRNHQAQRLFDGIAPQYDWVPDLLSFFQYQRWRRHLVARLKARPDSLVLDVCTGTAGVAIQTAQTQQCEVVGVDLSPGMIKQAQQNVSRNGLTSQVPLVMGRAESLAFADGCFDAVSVTFLLRYIDDPDSTFQEIIRVLKQGGRLLSLEFGVPSNRIARLLWYFYTRGVLPIGGALVSQSWRKVGGFLGPSISGLYQTYTEDELRALWIRLGMADVQVKRLSFGGAVIMWGTKVG